MERGPAAANGAAPPAVDRPRGGPERLAGSRPFAVLVVLLLLSGCAAQRPDERPARIVRLDMFDGSFRPAELTISSPETVLFVFTNRGTVDHEFFLADDNSHARYEEALQRGEERDPSAVTVAPGRTGEFSNYFRLPGTVVIACHMPGQFDAGMRLLVNVS